MDTSDNKLSFVIGKKNYIGFLNTKRYRFSKQQLIVSYNFNFIFY